MVLRFSSLGFKLVLDVDFCIRKNFINTVRLKLHRKEEEVKNKLSMEWWNRFVYASPTDRDWQGLPSKKPLKLFWKKSILSIYLICLGLSFFPWNHTGLFKLSGTGIIFTIYSNSGSSLVQFVIVFEFS